MKSNNPALVATVAFVIFGIVILFSCTKNKPLPCFTNKIPFCNVIDSNIVDSINCVKSILHNNRISSITGPTTANVGQAVNFAITALGNDGCTNSVTFPISNASATNILVDAKIIYSGCNCTQAITPINGTFTHTFSTAGAYNISGTDINNAIITHTIVVQ